MHSEAKLLNCSLGVARTRGASAHARAAQWRSGEPQSHLVCCFLSCCLIMTRNSSSVIFSLSWINPALSACQGVCNRWLAGGLSSEGVGGRRVVGKLRARGGGGASEKEVTEKRERRNWIRGKRYVVEHVLDIGIDHIVAERLAVHLSHGLEFLRESEPTRARFSCGLAGRGRGTKAEPEY